MKRRMRVLVTGVGSTTAICVIKGLKKQHHYDVFIVGTDTNEKANIAGSAFCDSFYKVPPANQAENYINAIQDIIRKESVDLLIPIVNAELEIIAKNRKPIEKLTYLLLSSYETVMTCTDKFRTHKFLEENGLPTVKTFKVDNIENLKSILLRSGIAFPLIAKPQKGLGSVDVYEIFSEEELSLIKRIKDPIIQEKAMGQEYTIDVFCDGEKMVIAVPRKRIETRSGVSYKGQTEKHERFIEYARMISEKLHIKGPANIQCFKKDDDIKFIEINPRFSGGLSLTIESGVNTPLLALKMAAGEELKPLRDFRIVKMCRYWEEVFYNEG